MIPSIEARAAYGEPNPKQARLRSYRRTNRAIEAQYMTTHLRTRQATSHAFHGQHLDMEPYMSIVSLDAAGTWQLNLPTALKGHEDELESLLHKVFTGDISSAKKKNLALAQQMSLNWCTFKCRQIGISFEPSRPNT